MGILSSCSCYGHSYSGSGYIDSATESLSSVLLCRIMATPGARKLIHSFRPHFPPAPLRHHFSIEEAQEHPSSPLRTPYPLEHGNPFATSTDFHSLPTRISTSAASTSSTSRETIPRELRAQLGMTPMHVVGLQVCLCSIAIYLFRSQI